MEKYNLALIALAVGIALFSFGEFLRYQGKKQDKKSKNAGNSK